MEIGLLSATFLCSFKSVICFGKAVVDLRQNAKYPKLEINGRGSLKVVYVLKTKCASAHADMLALRFAHARWSDLWS